MKQELNSTFWGLLTISIGIIILGWFFHSAVGSMKERERTVSVKGLSEREVKADKVIWPLVYKQANNNLEDLYANMEATNNAIVKFLVSNGVDESEITISPSSVFDSDAERYSSSEVKYRYKVLGIVTVATDKVDVVRKLREKQGDLVKNGIALTEEEYQYQIQYSFNGLNDVKPEMIEEATKNARASAEKFAADSHSSLGKIKTANQGQFSISDRDGNTPYIKTVRVVTTIEYYLKD